MGHVGRGPEGRLDVREDAAAGADVVARIERVVDPRVRTANTEVAHVERHRLRRHPLVGADRGVDDRLAIRRGGERVDAGDRSRPLLDWGHLLEAPLPVSGVRGACRGTQDGCQAGGQQRRPAAPPTRDRSPTAIHALSSAQRHDETHREPPRLNVTDLLNVRPDPPVGVYRTCTVTFSTPERDLANARLPAAVNRSCTDALPAFLTFTDDLDKYLPVVTTVPAPGSA